LHQEVIVLQEQASSIGMESKWLSANNGGITDISSNREHTSLFKTLHLVVQHSFLHQSFLDMLPPLLPKGKRGGCREATLSRLLL